MKAPTKEALESYLRVDTNCPWCDSDELDAAGPMEMDVNTAWQEISCLNCGAVWDDVYRLQTICWDDGKDRVYGDEFYGKEDGDEFYGKEDDLTPENH